VRLIDASGRSVVRTISGPLLQRTIIRGCKKMLTEVCVKQTNLPISNDFPSPPMAMAVGVTFACPFSFFTFTSALCCFSLFTSQNLTELSCAAVTITSLSHGCHMPVVMFDVWPLVRVSNDPLWDYYFKYLLCVRNVRNVLIAFDKLNSASRYLVTHGLRSIRLWDYIHTLKIHRGQIFSLEAKHWWLKYGLRCCYIRVCWSNPPY